MRAYRLKKPVPGLKEGAVFVHDEADSVKGSISCGCLKLAWNAGYCQQNWVAETHIFPGQLATDTEWFEEIENPSPPLPKCRYHL